MTRQPGKPCDWPGCRGLAPVGQHRRYCDKHKAIDDREAEERRKHMEVRRGTTKERGYAGTWRRLRKRVLQREPLCRRCGTAPATMVDHIVPIADGGARRAESNLQPLCEDCHDDKTAEDLARRRQREGGGLVAGKRRG